MKKIIVNGKIIDETSNIIDANNRGLKFADGVFETIRVEKSIPYMWHEHLARLNNGLSITEIKCDTENLYQECLELLQANNQKDAILRVMVTRGGKSKGYLPIDDSESLTIIQSMDLPSYNMEMVNLWVGSYKKIPSACLPPNVKYNQAMHSILSKIEAEENNCFESLVLNIDESISETCSGNIFWIKDDELYTPSIECNILPGTMREAILRLLGAAVKEGVFYLDDLKNASEVFITNSVWKIQKISSIEPLGYSYQNGIYANKILKRIEENIKNYAVY